MSLHRYGIIKLVLFQRSREKHWHVVLALAAIVASAAMTVMALVTAHSHPSEHACKVCAVGHLPCIEARSTVTVDLPEAAPWTVSQAVRTTLLENSKFSRDSRGPPV